MLKNKLLATFTAYLLVVSCAFAHDNVQPANSLDEALTAAKIDTVLLNSILKKLADPVAANSPKADSLALIILERFKSIGYTDGICRATHFIATQNYRNGNFKQALDYHKDLLKILPDANSDPTLIAGTYRYIAGEYFNLGSYDSAIYYGEQAIMEYSVTKDSQNIARALNLLGGIYWSRGSYTKASEKFFESLKIKEALSDTLGAANTYNNIGLIFDSQSKLPEALEMYQKSLDTYTKTGNSRGIGKACNNIAIIKKNQGKYSESLEMFMRSLEIDRTVNNIDEMGKTLNNIGLLYLDINNIPSGIDYFNQAFAAFTQSGNDNGLTAVYINLGRANLIQNNYANAEMYYQKGFKLASKIKSSEWMRDSYQGLYLVSKKIGKYRAAMVFHEKYMVLNDSLRSIENLNKLDQLKVEFETDKQEKEIAILSKDNELNILKLKKQESYSRLLTTIMLSVALILIITFIYNHQLRTDKKLLLQKNHEISQQKEEIQSQRDLLESTITELNQQKEELISQSEQIEKQNRFITGINVRMTEGLEYASLIQQSLLPRITLFENYFNNHFILFKPKNLVSGDLYWLWENGGDLIFAVADCTGHGVAGAFMSVMVVSLLKDAIGVNRLTQPSQIAEYLSRELSKSSSTEDTIVGVDFIICNFSSSTKELSYSGNHINFMLSTANGVEIVKVRQRHNSGEIDKTFTTNSINLNKGDRLYFYTDGYTDQLSGVKRKKMGRVEFQELLQAIKEQPYSLHKEGIDAFFEKWRGDFDQIDDVLVLGLEV